MAIEISSRTVYVSSRSGRAYLTKAAAINAEARRIILAKYPTEKGDETGGYWHWTELRRSEVMYRRIVRMVKAQLL